MESAFSPYEKQAKKKVKITKKLLTWRRNSGADVEIIATSLGGAGHKQVAVFVLWSKLSLANF